MKLLFETAATHQGNSQGHVHTEDDILNLEIRTADEQGPNPKKATFPEQLMAAAYASSFAAALELAAEEEGVQGTEDISVQVQLAGKLEDEEMFLEATIDAYIPGVDQEQGEDLIDIAYEYCMFSRATQDNITVHLNLLMDQE